MSVLKSSMRLGFAAAEKGLDRVFGSRANPLYHLGALGFFMYWIVAVTGIYIYIFFDTGITAAYDSVEYLTHDQWYLGGVMRSFHRYASDAMVLFMVVHIFREFALDRYRGARWFTWFTGTPIVILVFACGISGYWLVWDRMAQYIAVATTEWLDWLPIFGTSIAANFLTSESLDDRFFSLMIFIHIAAPLILLAVLWIHLQRVTKPQTNPPRALAIGTLAAMLVLSIVKPAVSHGPADLSTIVAVIQLDWFYLGLYPLLDYWSAGTVWLTLAVVLVILAALPWLPPMRRQPAAMVTLDQCNGCARCVADCPFGAIRMMPRSDGAKFDAEAVVSPDLCVSCGICVGACPTSTPFRRRAELVSGIDLPGFSIADLRKCVHKAAETLTGANRVLVFACQHGVRAADQAMAGTGVVTVPCAGMVPPAFIDYVLSTDLADGVMMAGCAEGECYNRFGIAWTNARIDGTRDPHLRERVPRERLARFWGGALERAAYRRAVTGFAASLDGVLPRRAAEPPRPPAQPRRKRQANPAPADEVANDA